MSLERNETRVVTYKTFLSDLELDFTIAEENGYVLLDIDGGDPYNLTPLQLITLAAHLNEVAKEASEMGLA